LIFFFVVIVAGLITRTFTRTSLLVVARSTIFRHLFPCHSELFVVKKNVVKG